MSQTGPETGQAPGPIAPHDPPPASLVPGHAGPVNALVVGASQGIGLAFAQQLAADPRVERLFLASRSAPTSAALQALQPEPGPRIHLLACDITDEHSLEALCESLAPAGRLHLVLNTAGVLHGPGLSPEKSLPQLALASLQRSFAVNAFGPILLARAVLPLLTHGDPVVFASLSARVGSIGDNRLGGWYAYRAAKAAQNQLLRNFAIELTRLNRRSIVLALHPGTVATGLSQPFSANVAAGKLFTPGFASHRLLEVIAARSASDSGSFYAWDGKVVPW